MAERPGKRPRFEAGSPGMPANAEHSTARGSPRSSTAVCEAWAEPQNEVPLPPGSLLEDLGRRPPMELAPSLEAFLLSYLRPPDGHSRPVIITGATGGSGCWSNPNYSIQCLSCTKLQGQWHTGQRWRGGAIRGTWIRLPGHAQCLWR